MAVPATLIIHWFIKLSVQTYPKSYDAFELFSSSRPTLVITKLFLDGKESNLISSLSFDY